MGNSQFSGGFDENFRKSGRERHWRGKGHFAARDIVRLLPQIDWFCLVRVDLCRRVREGLLVLRCADACKNMPATPP